MAIFVNKKTHILVVDDDTDLLILFRGSMQARDYVVDISVNGDNIWECIEKKRPDVIMLDVHMNGKKGSDICKDLKKKDTTLSIPIIMLSATDDLKKVAEDCGADSYLSKPFNADKVAYEIEKILTKNN